MRFKSSEIVHTRCARAAKSPCARMIILPMTVLSRV